MGRKKRGKVNYHFRLSPETHYSFMRTIEELGFKEIEEGLAFMVAITRALFITGTQLSKTGTQKNDNWDAEKNIWDAVINNWDAVMSHYKKTVERQELPERLKTLRDKLLSSSKPDLLQRLASLTAEVSLANPKIYIESEINRESEIDKDNNSRHSTYVECLGGLQDPKGSFRPQKPDTTPNTPLITEKEEKNIKVPPLANDLQSQYSGSFPERMEEHRKRLSKLLQDGGLRWKVERLMKVVKEWEREWGKWDEKWDGYLIDILRYVHENRVVGKVRKFKFPEDVEPSFPYIVVPVLKQIAKAQAEGREKVETLLGDITLKKKKEKGLSAKDVIRLWNELAEKDLLLSKTEATPFLVANIESYLKLHPEKEWWERVFRAVPLAIKRTSDPSSPRDMSWLFREGKNGRIIDWVLRISTEKKGEDNQVFLVYKDDLRQLCEECGIEKQELVSLMKERGLRLVDRGKELTIGVTGKGADKFSALLREKKSREALEFLQNLKEVVI